MSSLASPTIVLLQGSFQLPEVYHKFADLIRSHGFTVVQPTYPSLTDQDAPGFTSKTLTTDADAVEAVIKTLVEDEGKTVMVVMHSYGGLVGSEAIPGALTYASRRERDLPGGVARLFYLAAFVLPRGQSGTSTAGPAASPNEWADGQGRFGLRDPLGLIYDDLPPEEGRHWAERTVLQSCAVKDTVMVRCAYGHPDLPSTYVVCAADRAVPAAAQEMFATAAGAVVRKVEAGHSAFLSKPDEVMGLIKEAAGVAVSEAEVV